MISFFLVMNLNKKNVLFLFLTIACSLTSLYIFNVSNKPSILVNYLAIFYKKHTDLNESNKLFSIVFESNCECKKFKQIALNRYETHLAVVSIDKRKNSRKLLYNLTFDEFRELNLTCNLYDSFRRGKFQKILSYTLYGRNYFYYDKLKDINKQIKQLYPEWSMRVYHDNSINDSIICQLKCLNSEKSNTLLDNVDFCNIQNDLRLKPMLIDSISNATLNGDSVHAEMWRFFPIGDSFVDIFSSRDSDSYVLQREVDSVNVWLNSSKIAHIMRGNFLKLTR